MTQRTIHRSESRGLADHGWLKSRHSFSFGAYHNPERMGFGALRVLNDDVVLGGMGFGEHPHRDMEIVSIPLAGDLEHRDSMGNRTVIRKGDIQVMSAGTGVRHSEYNHSREQTVEFLQIWVIPEVLDAPPRYDQRSIDLETRRNGLLQVLSPDPGDEGIWIHQQAWFHMGAFDRDAETSYTLKKKGDGVYAFVVKGGFTVDGTRLGERDGMGLTGTEGFTLRAESDDARILLMEVPMHIPRNK